MTPQNQPTPAADHDAQQQRLVQARARLQRVGGVPSLAVLVAKFGHWPVVEASGKPVPPKE